MHMRGRFLPSTRLVFMIAVGPIAAAGCVSHDLNSAYERLGVTLEDGALRVRYQACDDETLGSLTLYLLDGDNIAPEEGDALIWTADPEWLRDPDGRGVIASRDGQPLQLEADEDYFLVVETSRGAADTDFATDAFVGPHQDDILSGAGFRSESAFLQRAFDSCSDP
jgi:hypothetical protein